MEEGRGVGGRRGGGVDVYKLLKEDDGIQRLLRELMCEGVFKG